MVVDAVYRNLEGAGGRLFADPQPAPDETSFQVDNTSEAYYESAYYKLHQNDLQPIPAPRVAAAAGRPRRRARRRVPRADRRREEDQLPRRRRHRRREGQQLPDRRAGARERGERRRRDGRRRPGRRRRPAPAFFFHLGDVVYNFGEGQYYYDQFYEPFRDYDRPIFAIPGNHDGMVFGDRPDVPRVPTLTAFLRNFCAADAGPLAGRRRPRPHDDGPARRLLHARRAVRLDRRPLHQRARGPGRHLRSGRPLSALDATSSSDFLEAELQRLAPAREAERTSRDRRLPPPAGLGRRKHGGTHRPGPRHRHAPHARPASGPTPSSPATPTSTSASPARVDGARDPLRRRRQRRLRGHAADRRPAEGPGHPRRVHLVKPPIVEFGYLTVTVDMTARPPPYDRLQRPHEHADARHHPPQPQDRQISPADH